MEFIITGLFIIFFSYILLYSLYDFLFKRSTIEGMDTESDEKSEKSTDADTTSDKKQKDNKSKSDDASNLQKAQQASSMANDADTKIAAQNAKHKHMTIDNAMGGVNNPNNP
jgi:hypothetical protein